MDGRQWEKGMIGEKDSVEQEEEEEEVIKENSRRRRRRRWKRQGEDK